MAVCRGVRKDGTPCESQVLCDGTYCYVHAPGRREERAEARRRGGTNRATAKRLAKIMPARLLPVWEQLEGVLADVIAGTMDPKNAAAAASVARALVAVLQAGEQEERIRRLEAQRDEARHQTWPA